MMAEGATFEDILHHVDLTLASKVLPYWHSEEEIEEAEANGFVESDVYRFQCGAVEAARHLRKGLLGWRDGNEAEFLEGMRALAIVLFVLVPQDEDEDEERIGT